jgi:putative aldouronate transport system permease protein
MVKSNETIAPAARSKLGYRFKIKFTRYWQLYLLLLLPLIYILIFNYYPMLGLQIAFKKFSPREGIWGGEWVGFKYFVKFFSTYKFWEILRNTIVISGYQILANIPIPIILALVINVIRNKVFKKTVQLLSYLPHFISTVVIVSMLLQMFNTRSGMFATIFGLFGIQIPDVFASPTAFPHLFVWSGVWQNAGWATIIYLAALAGVDPSQHEAAIVDGASRFQRVIYIDIPVLIPTAVILLIMNMGRVMTLGFEKVYLMQNSLNISASEIISTYVYKIGLTGTADYSYATAIGLFNSVVNLMLIMVTNKVSNKITGSGLF